MRGCFIFYGRACAFWTLAAVVIVLTPPVDGQSVISTRSGIVHFFEGAVYLGDQPLESHPGEFSNVPKVPNYARRKAVRRCCLRPMSSSA